MEYPEGVYSLAYVLDRQPIQREEAEKIVECLAWCESGNSETNLNPIDTDGLPAKGLLQFKQKTFDFYCDGDIWSGSDQIKCAINMIENGELHQWGDICRNKCQ